MAARDGSGLRPRAAEPGVEGEPRPPAGRELTEANRFTYAALCGIALSNLFPEPEQRSFCMDFVAGLVKWLDLSEAVLPTMTAFASGLGGEGADVFAQVLLKDPILKDDPLVITQDLLSFSLKDGHYDARARVLICHMASLLRAPLEELDLLEETFLESLKETKEEDSETAEASRKKKENRRKWKRYLLIGLATVGGGTVIGVTGGLAAPLVAAGAATVIGSAGAAALGSAAGIAIMTSLFGAAGAGLTGYKMKKRVGAIEEFAFLPLTEGRQLHITIAITGWLASGKYLFWPGEFHEQRSLAGNTLPGHRESETAERLSHPLFLRRPIKWSGMPISFRIFYNCQGIVEDVVLLGAPVDGEAKQWEPFRKVVSGRIVNGYCRADWLLSFVYRTSSVRLRVAGLHPVLLQDRRVENVDLSSVVSGHLDYARQMDVILKAVGIRTKPSWDEKGLLLAPGSLPPEESRQAAAASSSDRTTNPDGQTQGPTSGDTPEAATPPDLSQAQVPAGLEQSEGASLPAATSPAESPPLCSHSLGASPLGCPDCASETQGPRPGLV
ncbi:hypothetical protein FD754_009175 [Muntiacus muntjak]|uniref:Transmembrane and coiled-coil domain-containing protein 4 n=1 Tax=Muntiacus muntjak TaxID=9888 RepID=A0A5N3WT03_MUNMU|nr:hypothetical protein FD754_009175 [Muntiacus muntjak]